MIETLYSEPIEPEDAGKWPTTLERYASIVLNAADGVFQSTPEGRYLLANPALARIYGYASPQELVDSVDSISDSIYVDPVEREAFKMRMARDGEVRRLEYRVRRKDGSVIWIAEDARAVRDERNRVLYYEGFVRDITERKKTEAELRQAKEAAEAASRAKSQFLAVMSHEIRTPLNGINGMASLLLDSVSDDEQLDSLRTIRNCCHSLTRLVDDILDISKIESNRIEIADEAFSLRECIQDVVQLLEFQAAEKGLALAIRISDTAPERVGGDLVRLRQILLNLLGNALKFTDAGTVELSLESVQAESVSASGTAESFRIHFSVRDTGIGIPEDAMGRLFQTFSQVDATATRRYGGTGLGLAISRQLARLMGGDVTVESRLGHGSTFRFDIVVRAIPEDRASKRPSGSRSRHDAVALVARETVADERGGAEVGLLLAEDNPVNQKVATRMLRRIGLEPDCVANGLEVLEAVKRRPYQIILMDLQMPEMDGLEATRALRDDPPEGPRPWIIALTANAMQSDRDRCREAGMDDFLSKPLSPDALASALARALRQAGCSV